MFQRCKIQCPGMEQYGINCLAKAYESIPRQLAENSGQDPSKVISKLLAAHSASEGKLTFKCWFTFKKWIYKGSGHPDLHLTEWEVLSYPMSRLLFRVQSAKLSEWLSRSGVWQTSINVPRWPRLWLHLTPLFKRPNPKIWVVILECVVSLDF